MSRTRPWTVMLLVAVTGLALGFTRLDAVRRAPPRRPAPVAAEVKNSVEEDSKKLREYLEELVQYLEENESNEVPYVTLPPFEDLPALPSELLPETA